LVNAYAYSLISAINLLIKKQPRPKSTVFIGFFYKTTFLLIIIEIPFISLILAKKWDLTYFPALIPSRPTWSNIGAWGKDALFPSL
jgi:hypothetical protein